jgi:flagellar biosynthesis protein FlhB
MADHDQRTEQPTQRRVEKAREQGQFLAARDFVGAVQFTAATGLIVFLGSGWLTNTQRIFSLLLRSAFNRELDAAHLIALTQTVLMNLCLPLAAAGALLAGLSLATQLSLSAVGFSFKSLAPNFGRLNPFKKLGEIAGQLVSAIIHTTVLLAAITGIAYWIVSDQLPVVMSMSLATVQAGAALVGSAIAGLLWKCSIVLLTFGAIDIFRQKRKLDKQLRMTKQEVRDEMKENEGNPHIKGQIRRLRRQLLRGRMMSEVPKATVVLVNPTHFSVAIRYDAETMASPVVVAKGKNYLAKLIREKATKHHVPIVENPPLSRALYSSANVGQQIPIEFYRAVAEILAYLYRMMNR